MGGYNSGRRGGRPLADEALRIDLAWMIRTGQAVPGQSVRGALRWTCRGKPSGAIGYDADLRDVDAARLILSYTYTRDGVQEDVRQTVRLVSTLPHFGGRRWWMICPVSGARVGKLYLPSGGDRFASRAAWQLGYHSQRHAKRDRPFERLFRLQRRLGGIQGYDCFLMRPKGMWHATFARHEARYRQLDDACTREWRGMTSRIAAMRAQ